MAFVFLGANMKMNFWSIIRGFAKMSRFCMLEYRSNRNYEYFRNLNAQRILVNKGVNIKGPIEVGPEVDLDRIEPGVALEYGVKLFGPDTLLRTGATLDDGTYRNVAVGKNVTLGKGDYTGSVFLDQASVRYGSEIRTGTLYEEGANSGHIVGTKLTILGPFVCLGSNINFCDVINVGGSASHKDDYLNFNEIGSGLIHYNFTPYGDKFSSYIGSDVAEAVFMDSPKTFLGGQARLIAPNIVRDGVTVAAGCDLRKSVPPGKLLVTEGVSSKRVEVDYDPTVYGRISDKLERTVFIIANLKTLLVWYKACRMKTCGDDKHQLALYELAVRYIQKHIDERIFWMANLVSKKLPLSLNKLKALFLAETENPTKGTAVLEKTKKNIEDQELTIRAWKCIEPICARDEFEWFDSGLEEAFLADAVPVIQAEIAGGELFVHGVQKLPPETVALGKKWLKQGYKLMLEEASKGLENRTSIF